MMEFFNAALGKNKRVAEQYEPTQKPTASTQDKADKTKPKKPVHGEQGTCCGACGGR
ncbi:MAG: CCGSCS motif protein [Gammaproteobacteria bacterium]|nr:CCGSCS motif protein [Gammaproteobacteria bacterium]